MGLLTQEYYQDLLKDMPLPAPISPEPALELPAVTAPAPLPTEETGFQKVRQASLEVQRAFGFRLPDNEVFDKMSRTERLGLLGGNLVALPVKLALGAPKAIAASIPSFAANVAPLFTKEGRKMSFEELAARKLDLPVVGEVPNYFAEGKKSMEAMRAFGFGPLLSSLAAGGTIASYALGDLSIAGALAEGIGAAVRPRKALKEGETVKNISPIQQAIVEENNQLKSIRKNPDSQSEYYSMPKTFAKEQAERAVGALGFKIPGNVMLKLTPAGEGAMEISIVQRLPGPIQSGAEYIKNKFGIPTRVYQGDFGPEIKLSSQVVSISKAEAEAGFKQAPLSSDIQEAASFTLFELSTAEKGRRAFVEAEVGGGSEVVGLKSRFLDWVSKELRSRKLFDAVSEKITAEGPMKFGAKEQRLVNTLVNRVAELTGRMPADITPDMFKGEFMKIKILERDTAQLLPLQEIPLRGMENRPVTSEQMANLDRIGRVVGMAAEVKNSIIKTVTGKDAMGALTQAEYNQAAKALSLFRDVFDPGAPILNFRRYVSPQRYWMRTQEEKNGIPLYSEVYVPMEDAARAQKVFVDAAENRLSEIFGKYDSAGFSEERRLIKKFMEGDKGVILDNAALSQATKSELVGTADALRDFYNETGPKLDVPTEAFLAGEYQPRISDLGGIYQQYKKGSQLPTISFFAKFKRRGSLSEQVEDARALASIYVRAGAKHVFYEPVVNRAAQLYQEMPVPLQDSMKSYIFEKLGYAGELERTIDNLALDINRKMGWNLPSDLSRQVTQVGLNTVYSGALGLNPGAAFRNILQLPLMTYPRLGPKFMAEAWEKSLTKEGVQVVRDAGFLVDLGVPYGEEIAKTGNIAGKASNAYRAATQASLVPYEIADTFSRTATYWQTKFQFEDALARYNKGEITWQQLEGKNNLDFGALNPVDRNIIRQRLVGGDIEGAFNQYVRDIIDDTQFPYRRGSSARVTYGVAGKLGTTFLQWPLEYAHTLSTYVARRQWDKLVRFYAVSTAIHRGMSEQFGFDFRRSIGTGPLDPSLSPAAKTAYDTLAGLNAVWEGNDQALEDYKADIAKELFLGIPAGLEARRVNSFRKSYLAGPMGPNQTYPVYAASGKLLYYGTFKDIFWQALGFPTNEKEAQSKLRGDLRRAGFNASLQKKKVLQLWQQEKYDEAARLIEQSGLVFDPDSFANELEKSYIPMSQQLFNSLPDTLKPYFVERVFPESNQ